MRILKFGGKSLDTPEKVQKICKNIKKIYKNDKKLIVIVSAIGDSTNQLIEKSKNYYNKKLSQRELDVLLSTGETQSAALFAMTLNSLGVKAKSFQAWQLKINTFGDFQNSLITNVDKTTLDECLSQNYVAVVAGFQGVNNHNEITTLGRGGSDTTAAALAATFSVDAEIYSDYNGVFSGDPRLDKFKKIKHLEYKQISNMADSGAKVLEKRASQIAENSNIKIICKQSNNFKKYGTSISSLESSFISVSTISNLAKISIDFSKDKHILFLVKNVLNSINNLSFYNFTIKSEQIEFFIQDEHKAEILKQISSKYKLLRK